jgi:hypothetical protein
MQFLSVFVESRQAARNVLQLGMLLLGCCLATFGQEATIVGTVSDPNNGGISVNQGAGNFGAVTSAFDPREFQLGAKLFF